MPRPALQRFLDRSFPGAAVRAMAGDASSRAFYRIRRPDGSTVVLMDYGEPFDGETDDMRLERLFREAALPVARILEAVPVPGCLVLEDLGERSLERAARDEGTRPALYGRAARLAADVADRGTRVLAGSERAGGPALDADRFRFEVDYFAENYLGRLKGMEASPDLRASLHRLADEAADTPRKVLCHRDFHSRNLVVRDDGSLAMVDIQDARWGPDTYDLASLARDAYVDLDETLANRIVEVYLEALPWNPERERFLERLEAVSLQRMIKALGTFGHQAAVRGRESYLEGVPRTLARIRRLLEGSKRFSELADRLGDAYLL